WLVGCVRNRAMDGLRGRGAHAQGGVALMPGVGGTGTGSDPWREVSRSLERTAIREALASLPAEQRQAVELAYYGGYSYSEIAEMVRVPLSTIKGRARLALEKLHSYLAGRGLVTDAG